MTSPDIPSLIHKLRNAPQLVGNCIGPQPGQTKCPCALQGEAEVGRKMVEDGVTINGKRYRLVPE
jgi:hypothetical protein